MAKKANNPPKPATASRGAKAAKISAKATKKPASKLTGSIGLSAPAEIKNAKTAAKKTRIKISGADTRVRGHVSAQGKRAQSRRDAKG